MRGVSVSDDAIALMRTCGTKSAASDNVIATTSHLAVPIEVCMEKPYCIATLEYSTNEAPVSWTKEKVVACILREAVGHGYALSCRVGNGRPGKLLKNQG